MHTLYSLFRALQRFACACSSGKCRVATPNFSTRRDKAVRKHQKPLSVALHQVSLKEDLDATSNLVNLPLPQRPDSEAPLQYNAAWLSDFRRAHTQIPSSMLSGDAFTRFYTRVYRYAAACFYVRRTSFSQATLQWPSSIIAHYSMCNSTACLCTSKNSCIPGKKTCSVL